MALEFVNKNTNELKTAVFCFTGKAPKTRVEMTDIALKAGASVTKQITWATTILVIANANSQSSKAVKARSRSLAIISPEQFFELCDTTLSFKSQFMTLTQARALKPKPKPITEPPGKRKHSSVRRIQL